MTLQPRPSALDCPLADAVEPGIGDHALRLPWTVRQIGEQPADRRFDLRLGRLALRCASDLLEDEVRAAFGLADELEAVDALDGWDFDDRRGEPESRRFVGDV